MKDPAVPSQNFGTGCLFFHLYVPFKTVRVFRLHRKKT